MNLWECDHPGCKSTAVGVGGAIGLLAIGWHFTPGTETSDKPDATPLEVLARIQSDLANPAFAPKLYCPAHRPDPAPPNERTLDCLKYSTKSQLAMCGQCRAEQWAEKIQAWIEWEWPNSEAT